MTEYESFHPRHAVTYVDEHGSTKAVPAFTRGKDGVTRIVREDRIVRVEYEKRPALELIVSDGHGVVRAEPPPPPPVPSQQHGKKR